jgi:hypothetical protein
MSSPDNSAETIFPDSFIENSLLGIGLEKLSWEKLTREKLQPGQTVAGKNRPGKIDREKLSRKKLPSEKLKSVNHFFSWEFVILSFFWSKPFKNDLFEVNYKDTKDAENRVKILLCV